MICIRCNEVVKMGEYDTGEEWYCKCQCTLWAEFDEKLWKKEDEMKIELMKGNLFFEFEKEGGEESKTDGGIIVPEQKDTFIRKVTIAGPNEQGIKAGDKVLLNPHVQMMEFRIGLKWYRLCPATMIVAILKDS